MPRYSHRQQILKSLDQTLLSLISNHSTDFGIPLTTTPSLIPLLVTALILASPTEYNKDLSDIDDLQDSLIMMVFLMMTLSSMFQQTHLLLHKRKREEEDHRLSSLLLVRNQAYKRRYIHRRFRKPPVISKADTFNGWFNETNRTWLTVVRLFLT